MAKVILSAEGQTLDLPDEIASDDAMLRQALVAYYPQLATAKIERVKDGSGLRVTVSKQAGPKGALRGTLRGTPRKRASAEQTLVDVLVAAPEHLNPAVELLEELRAGGTRPEDLPVAEIVALGDLIEATNKAASDEIAAVNTLFEALREAAPVAAKAPVAGF